MAESVDALVLPPTLSGHVFYDPQPNPQEDRLKSYLSSCWPKYYKK